MTNHTEMEQREKFEAWAEEVGAQPWGYLKKQRNPSGGYSVQIYTYMWAAWKAAGSELVEALEKAQQRIAELDNDCWTYENTVKNLLERAGSAEVACEMAAQILDRGERLALSRSLELLRSVSCGKDALESRTVTVKLPTPLGWKPPSGRDVVRLDDVKKTLTAAGIKVEAE